jgi:hypothetical protein
MADEMAAPPAWLVWRLALCEQLAGAARRAPSSSASGICDPTSAIPLDRIAISNLLHILFVLDS